MNWFRTTFVLLDNARPQRRCTVRTEDAISAGDQSIEKDRNQPIRHREQQLALRLSTLWKIFQKNFGLRVYKIQPMQELKPKEPQAT